MYSFENNNNDKDINTESQVVQIQNDDHTLLPQNGRDIINLSTPIILDANLEFTWSHMDVPWNKIPENLIKVLEEETKWQDCKSSISEICHTIVHEMRLIKTRIPVAAFKAIASKIVNKYPKTFRDIDADGVVIGDGSYFLIRKLIDRNNYLNRPHKRGFEGTSTPLKLRRKKMNMVAGCSKWEELTSPKEDQSDQIKLKSLKETDEEYYILLEKTYSDQRVFLNNIESPPTVDDIKLNWPCLFETSGIKWHFKKCTGIDLESLSTSMEEKADKIIQYGCDKKICSPEYDPNKKVEKCLQIYAKVFKEDLSKLLIVQV